eukprot:TRINITY_DN8569_c0_g1_i2.p1 TRINITY_DN8569_c0_g1~~TRINITY_DN8569_c0_g1_i2.p1  ORF type:complete len:322 (-),score=64.28 TRINITY_DN8569_c0_g1_i2:12-977(-)
MLPLLSDGSWFVVAFCRCHSSGGVVILTFFFFFFKQKTAYEMQRGLVGSEMCIRDRYQRRVHGENIMIRNADSFTNEDGLSIEGKENNSVLQGREKRGMSIGDSGSPDDFSSHYSLSAQPYNKKINYRLHDNPFFRKGYSEQAMSVHYGSELSDSCNSFHFPYRLARLKRHTRSSVSSLVKRRRSYFGSAFDQATKDSTSHNLVVSEDIGIINIDVNLKMKKPLKENQGSDSDSEFDRDSIYFDNSRQNLCENCQCIIIQFLFFIPVSYTHLTLPTILLVQISVVAVSLKKKKKNQTRESLMVLIKHIQIYRQRVPIQAPR